MSPIDRLTSLFSCCKKDKKPENKINGKKPLWAFVILLGGIGPLIYFFFAPKR